LRSQRITWLPDHRTSLACSNPDTSGRFLTRLLCQELWLRHLSRSDEKRKWAYGNSDRSDQCVSLFRKQNVRDIWC